MRHIVRLALPFALLTLLLLVVGRVVGGAFGMVMALAATLAGTITVLAQLDCCLADQVIKTGPRG